jgi:hypothetical protein
METVRAASTIGEPCGLVLRNSLLLPRNTIATITMTLFNLSDGWVGHNDLAKKSSHKRNEESQPKRSLGFNIDSNQGRESTKIHSPVEPENELERDLGRHSDQHTT